MAIADFFLSILVAFWAIDGVIVVPPLPSPPLLLSLSPSSSSRSPSLRTSTADPTQTKPKPGWVCQLLRLVWYRIWTSTSRVLFHPTRLSNRPSELCGSRPFCIIFVTLSNSISPSWHPCYYHSFASHFDDPLQIRPIASSLILPPNPFPLPLPPSFVYSSFLPPLASAATKAVYVTLSHSLVSLLWYACSSLLW